MRFAFSPGGLPGIVVIRPESRFDDRGRFAELFRRQDFEEAGLPGDFVQENESFSRAGTLRGLHFQRTRPQGKLLRVLAGELFDVVVDLRRDSPSFGRWEGRILSAEAGESLYVPPGFAHGFLALSEPTRLSYKCTAYYAPEDEDGLAWNDPFLHIEWPLEDLPLLSPRDRAWPRFNPDGTYCAAEGSRP